MKILILANDDGGLYKFRKELIQQLIKDKNQVFISLPEGSYIPFMKKMGCRFIKTPMERRGKNPLQDLKLCFQYHQVIRKLKPELVLTYTIKPNIYGGVLCRIYKIPYIANITGCGTAIENGGLLSKVLLFLYKISLKEASQVFFKNKENLNYFKQKVNVRVSRLLPGSGVNLEEHKYEEYPQEDGTLRILFVGRIMKDKGIEELLSCAEALADCYPNVYFDLVGGYDEKIYQNRIKELERKGAVKYLGIQDNVHMLMKTHHAVIMPSYHEGMSNVLLEAASTGRPVIASNIPGCREAYTEGLTGIGFQPKSAEEIIRAVKEFIALPYEKKAAMGKAGREKVKREFDRKIVVESYLQEIQKVLERL